MKETLALGNKEKVSSRERNGPQEEIRKRKCRQEGMRKRSQVGKGMVPKKK